MPDALALGFTGARLVVLKGDANYRKRKHSGSVASGIQPDRSSRVRASFGIDAHETRKGDREGRDAPGM